MIHLTRRHLLLACTALPFGARAAAPAAPSAQLANPYRPGVSLADYWVSEKYDGVRGLWDGEQLRTRQGRVIAAPAWFTQGWPGVALDGELWAGHGRFEAAASATASQQPDDAAWRAMRYMVFDLPTHPGPFDERLPILQAAVGRLGVPWVLAVPHRSVTDDAALQSLLQQTVARGGEGLMLRRGASPYRAKRNDDLLKLKPLLDAEATVVAHLPGQGKYQGLLGALQLRTDDGLSFRLGSGFTDADRQSPPPVGSRVTYRYRGLHDSGLPRFASYLRLRPAGID